MNFRTVPVHYDDGTLFPNKFKMCRQIRKSTYLLMFYFLNTFCYTNAAAVGGRKAMKMIIKLKYRDTFVLIITLFSQYNCYEKTLRKIVRNHSKMEQRPFSEGVGDRWKNISEKISQEFYPGYTHVNSVIHKMNRPKISTVLSSIDTGKSRTLLSRMNIAKNENIHPYELRMARDAIANVIQNNEDNFIFTDNLQHMRNINKSNDFKHFNIPTSRFFFSTNLTKENDTLDKDDAMMIPGDFKLEFDDVLEKKTESITDSIAIINNIENLPLINITGKENDIAQYKADYISQVPPATDKSHCSNYSKFPNSCSALYEVEADIDTQIKFEQFDIEPQWVVEKQFWNKMYESRYESLMRNPKWPPLKVILIPRSDVDSIWRRPFEKLHNDTVRNILSNIVKKLKFYPNLTFSWNEVSHLAYWWRNSRHKSRTALRRLVREGRLEITTGGWVETDESTSSLFGIIHLLIEGHQWLKHHLNCSPEIAWLTHSVTHNPTLPYLLSASGIYYLVFSNLHFSWQQYLTEYQHTDFVWIQNWDSNKDRDTKLNKASYKIGNDRYPKHSILTHYLQFNTAGFTACGPQGHVCDTEFNFANIHNKIDINPFNVKEKSEKLLEQYSKTGTTSSHNVVIAPVGDKFSYESQTEFDYQFNNHQKISDFVNVNQDIYKATIDFGTAKDYFKSVLSRHKTFPTLKGDFLTYADINRGRPNYWTGYFTTRPFLKILLRRIQSTLRSTEILFSLAYTFNVFKSYNTSYLIENLLNARENVARFQDRNVISGTLTTKAVKYVQTQILDTAKACWFIQETVASLLSSKPGLNETYLKKYVYREGEFISSFKSVTSGDQIYIFNSLNYERTEIVELTSRNFNLRVIDHNQNEVIIQVNPIWRYTIENKIKISSQFFKIIFAVVIPPMTFQLFKIKKSYDSSQSLSTIYCLKCEMDDVESGLGLPFIIHPIDIGDIQLENYRHRLVFDEYTGFLKTVIEKATNSEKKVLIDFSAFRSSRTKAGMFLLNINTSRPFEDILLPFRVDPKLKTMMIVSGQITTELVSIYGKLLQHSVKIYNLVNSPLSNAIKLETKVDYEVCPKHRDLEIFLSIQTDISNGNPMELFTDSNGFQFSRRTVNLNRRIESNVYPMTSMVFIEDHRSRLTIATDHSQGVTSLREGQVVIMLDRRVLYDDGRGSKEDLADSVTTYQTHYILLENFMGPKIQDDGPTARTNLKMPSLHSIYLAETLNYQLDIYFIEPSKTNNCLYAFLPLIKAPLPCDIAVINYRVNLHEGASLKYPPNSALMTLHRHSYSCSTAQGIDLHCSGDEVKLKKIFRNIKAVYRTNLVGTTDGPSADILNKDNFPPMEIITLRIQF